MKITPQQFFDAYQASETKYGVPYLTPAGKLMMPFTLGDVSNVSQIVFNYKTELKLNKQFDLLMPVPNAENRAKFDLVDSELCKASFRKKLSKLFREHLTAEA